jgi:hypothetical protein
VALGLSASFLDLATRPAIGVSWLLAHKTKIVGSFVQPRACFCSNSLAAQKTSLRCIRLGATEEYSGGNHRHNGLCGMYVQQPSNVDVIGFHFALPSGQACATMH